MDNTQNLDIQPNESELSTLPDEAENSAYRIFKTQEDFQKCLDKALGKRLLKSRQTEEELSRLKPIVELVCEQYGADDSEILSVLMSKSEAAQNKEEDSLQIKAEENEEFLSKLSEELSSFLTDDEIYTSEQKETLLCDERFLALVKNGFSAKEAFDALNTDKIIESRVKAQSDELLRNIRLRGLRPSENAVSGYGSFSSSLNPKNLTDAQRADIRERVRRGERIVF